MREVPNFTNYPNFPNHPVFPSVSWTVPDHYVFSTLKPRPLLGRPKGEVEMKKVGMGRHRSLEESPLR